MSRSPSQETVTRNRDFPTTKPRALSRNGSKPQPPPTIDNSHLLQADKRLEMNLTHAVDYQVCDVASCMWCCDAACGVTSLMCECGQIA